MRFVCLVDVACLDGLDARVAGLVVVLEGGLLVALVEVLDALGVLLLDLGGGLALALVELQVLLHLVALNRHDAHKVVGGVAQLGATVLVAKGRKVVNCEISLVEVDDLALGQKHKLVEDLKDV